MIAEALVSRVETIFLRVAELPEDDRPSYLEDACAGDSTIRAQVESLLRGGSGTISTLQLRQAAGLTLLTTTAEQLPIRLDRYDLDARLGEGSFGVVYLATQHTPVRRKVAVKVLKPGLDSADIVRRFEAERQALAALDHPNIARLLDAGNMPDGRPYFVMELLQGQPFTAYCDAQKLEVRQRLALFLDVCAGVEHAHRRGILHRDLKPSNILVVEQDERASVKVIDFGIARALKGEVAFGTLATEIGRPMGTLAYMSPEQAAGSPDIDTTSDVYSLGILLYESLAGLKPFDNEFFRQQTYEELRRLIEATEPPRPSNRLLAIGEEAKRIAGERQSDPEQLARQLRRELEWIPLRAIRKERQRRYASVQQLAQDIEHYLQGRPLLAGPESRSYQFRKFVGRHSAGALIAAAFVILAVSGMAFYLRSMRSEQARTRVALDDAEATVQYLSDMLASVEPARAQGKPVLVQEMLDRAAKTVGEQFSGKPAIERRLRLTVGQTYQALGKPEIAATHLQRASELANLDPTATAKDKFEATIELARALKDLARTNETEASLRQLLSQYQADATIDKSLILDAQALLGASIFEQGNWQLAESMFSQILEARRVAGEHDTDGLITALTDYGSVLIEQGKSRQAEPLLKDAVDRAVAKLGEKHPTTLGARAAYASALVTLARFKDAAPILQQTLDDAKLVWGLDHYQTLNVLVNYAGTLESLGDRAKAEVLYREAVDRNTSHLGDDHPLSLQYADQYAGVLENLGRIQEALTVADRVREARIKTMGEDHPYTLASTSRVGWLQLMSNETQGIATLKDGYQRALRVLGKEHPITLGLMNNFATSLGKTDPTQAESLMVELIAIRERNNGPDHPDTIGVMGNLGNLLGDYRRNAEALVLVADAFQRQRRVFGIDHPWTLTGMNNYALQLHYVGRDAEAEPVARECVERRLRVLGEEHPSTSTAMNNHALILDHLNRLSEAEQEYRRSMELRIKYTGIESAHSTNSQHNLAFFLVRQNRLSEAEPLSRAAYETSLKKYGPNHKDTRIFARYYAKLLEQKLNRRDDAVAVRLSAGLPAEDATTQPVTGPPAP